MPDIKCLALNRGKGYRDVFEISTILSLQEETFNVLVKNIQLIHFHYLYLKQYRSKEILSQELGENASLNNKIKK